MNAAGDLTEAPAVPSAGRLTRLFIPLAVQAASQSLCYPLVAMVAMRGPNGPSDLAGLAQSNTVLFFLGMFAISLVPTGMVYAHTREGYRRFHRLTLVIGVLAGAVQAVLCIPWASHILFESLIGLPPAMAAAAQVSLIASIPLQVLFFSRIPYFVAMYVGKATGIASLATIGRVAFTALLSPLFCLVGAVGPVWAVVALTLPVGLEAVVSGVFARRFIRQLPEDTAAPAAVRDILRFNLPLTVGGYFLSLATIGVAAFIARAPEPEIVLPVYYLVLGLANPVAFAATRMQTITLMFAPSPPVRRRTLQFSIGAGLILGLIPLTFILPGAAEMYYVRLQNLDPQHLWMVRRTAAALMFFPLAVALRAQIEGVAAYLRRSVSVLIGHAALLATIAGGGMAALALNLPGYLIGAFCLTLGSAASSATMHFSLKLGETSGR
ncbi:MAG: hypothetical protein EHM15_00335 [Desulfobacteraceae bacterium]|nr:MAG: hypothetical protein EHM15_00335 [Desulfobacteraceae bacterium]